MNQCSTKFSKIWNQLKKIYIYDTHKTVYPSMVKWSKTENFTKVKQPVYCDARNFLMRFKHEIMMKV